VWAADHLDTSAAATEPTADITDLYAWMDSAGEMLNLVLAVNANAGNSAVFSDAVTYVFHVDSTTGFGQPQTYENIVCRFADAANVECWAGGEYAAGDATDINGLSSNNGGFRVFAGLRDDPFFLEYAGFTAAVGAAVGAVGAGEVEFDGASCPLLTDEQQGALVGQLQSGPQGAPVSNTFAGQNVLALVVQIDKNLVNAGGPMLGVWASTHMSQ